MGVVRRYIDILTIIINFPIPLVLALFLAAAPLLLCSFFKCFSVFKNKKPKQRFFTSLGAHRNCAIMAMLYTHSIGNQP